MDISSITNRIWAIVGLIIVCLGVGYFFTYGMYNSYRTIESQLTVVEQQNASLSGNLATIDQFLKDYESRKDDTDTAELALPSKSKDVPNILSGLGDLAANSGVLLSNFQIIEPEEADSAAANTVQTIQITLGGSGTYPSFEDFVMRLENHLRLIDIKRINVSTQGDNSNLNYQINLKTYFQK